MEGIGVNAIAGREEVGLSTWINTRNMQPIVDKITPLIWTDINIVNAEGVIVASSRTYRIGKHHNGAHLLLEGGMDELIVEHTNDIPGVLHGVNFPITIENVRVGMIGITGVPAEVKLIAKLVRELLQIHIDQARKDQEKLQLEQLRSSFLYEWLFDAGAVAAPDFEERGRVLGIRVLNPWTVGIFFLRNQGLKRYDGIQSQVQRLLDDSGRGEMTLCIGDLLILLLGERSAQAAKQRMQRIQSLLESLGVGRLPAGVGRCALTRDGVRRSLQDARVACRVSRRDAARPVSCYDELGLELIVDSIPRSEKKRIFGRVFQDYTPEEIRQTMAMLKSYTRFSGSISRTAEELHIHKNSLQYRLRRLSERTGYVPQNIAHMSFLYALLLMYEGDAEEKSGEPEDGRSQTE